MKKFKNIALLCVLVLILAGCSAQQPGKVEYIGSEAAKELALDAAGLTDRQVQFSGADMNSRNNMDYYQVSFVSNGENYQYDIDALTGTVIDSKTPDIPQSPTIEKNQNGEKQTISKEEAKNAALAHAGVSADQVTFVKAGLDWDDGRQHYDVEFYTADYTEYDYDIDAYTGAVLSFDKDAEYYTPPATDPGTQQSPNNEQTPTVGKQVISKEEAKKAALSHAGISADQVTFVKAELDRDDGREYYDVEFYTADYKEYDYDIDAYTGAVLSYDRDAEHYTPPAGSSGTQITADEAKAKALAQVPGATLKDIREFSVDYDDGRLEYEGTIYYNKMEYEFEIDGYSGAIRSWEVESIYD